MLDSDSTVNVTRYDASINDARTPRKAQKSPQDPNRAQLHIHQYARNAVHLNPSPHSNGRRTPSGKYGEKIILMYFFERTNEITS